MSFGLDFTDRCPYVGLGPFQEQDRKYFFGREREIRVIASNLHETVTVFYGASGTGKTSVLRAGVVPYLKERDASVVYFDDWHTKDLSKSLQAKVAEHVTGALTQSRLDDVLARNGKQIFFIFDQFEEYLLYSPERRETADFDALLARIVNRADVLATVLIGIREDALSGLDQRFSIRIQDLLGNTLALELLAPDDARRAIREPLRVFNEEYVKDNNRFDIQPDLVEEIIHEVGRQRIANATEANGFESTPIREPKGIETTFLQLVLQRIWNQELKQDSRLLRLKTLKEDIGGGSQIMTGHVNDVMNELPAETDRDIAARMFEYLVTPSGTKVPQSTPDLVSYAKDREDRVRRVLHGLAEGPQARLLRRLNNPERYELFHDVLAKAILKWRDDWRLAKATADAKRAEQLALIRELTTAANSSLKVDPERSVLLARYSTEQLSRTRENDPAFSAAREAAENALFESLRSSHVRVRFSEHQSRLSGLAYDSTGQRIATVSEDGTARVWNAASAQPYCSLQPSAGWLYAVAFQPQGRYIAVAAEDGTVLLGDLEGRIERSWALSSKPLYSVAFHPGGHSIVVVGQEGRIWLLSLQSSSPEVVVERSRAAIYSVAISPDGNYVVSGGEDRVLHLFDLKSHRQILLKGHADSIKGVAFSPDGRLIASASQDGTARLWKLSSKRPLHTFYSGYHWLTAIAFGRSGRLLATGGTNNQATIWDINRMQPELSLIGHTDAIRAVAFSPDGARLSTASSDSTARIWQIAEQDPLLAEAHSGGIADIAFSSNGNLLATAGDDNTAKLWNVSSGQLMKVFAAQTADVNAVAFHDASNTLTTANWDCTIRIYDLPSAAQKRVYKRKERLLAATYSHDGRFLATAGDDHLATVWRVQSKGGTLLIQPIAKCEGHWRLVNGLAFSPDCKLLATSSDDKTVGLWEVTSGANVAVFKGDDAFQGIAFGLTGDRLSLVAASHNNKAAVWDVTSKKLRFELQGHRKLLHCVATSRDGKLAATASGDWTAKIWDLETGQEKQTLAGHAGEIWRVAFSPNGNYLATASLDRTVRIWHIETGKEITVLNSSDRYTQFRIDRNAWIYRITLPEMQQLALDHLSRWFTPEECKRYLHIENCAAVPDLRVKAGHHSRDELRAALAIPLAAFVHD